MRLAAAGVLALHGDEAGTDELLAGLDHERWEVRWWCGMGLVTLPGKDHGGALSARQQVETDPFVAEQLGRMAKGDSGWKAQE